MASTGVDVLKKSGGEGKARYGICFAPSQFIDVGPAKLFGWWAESLIMLNYLKKMQAAPFITDWFDLQQTVTGLPEPSPLDNPISFFNFLKRHHPQLAAQANAWNVEFSAGKTAVPDILTAKPDRHEYYEIKPGSVTGVKAGLDKLAKLNALFADPQFGLSLYKAGTKYTPSNEDDIDLTSKVPRILNIWARRLGLKKIKVVFTFRRSTTTPGLVLYWICIDVEADEDLEAEAVENVARWYTLHAARSLKAGAVMADAQAQPALEFDYAQPAVALLMPPQEAIRVSILSAGPAKEYAIVGSLAAADFVRQVTQVQIERQQEAFKKNVKVGVPGLPQLYTNPSAINRSSYDYPAALATAYVVGGAVIVIAALPLVVVAGIGAARAITVVAAGGGVAAGAGGGTLTTEVMVGKSVTEAAGEQAISLAARRAAMEAAKSAPARKMAAAAGMLLILGVSRDALAATNAPAPVPSITSLEGVRLMAAQDIASLKDAQPLGAVNLPGGTKGYFLGRIRLNFGSGIGLGLEPHKLSCRCAAPRNHENGACCDRGVYTHGSDPLRNEAVLMPGA